MNYQNIKEEELKNKVAQDYFWLYDCSKIIGNVDFCVGLHQSDTQLFEQESLLWAEAKKGKADVYHSFIQLILTIGKARTFDTYLPPAFLGAFDAEKIAFIPYNDIHNIFYQNDFNWNVTPSNHNTKEFKQIEQQVKNSLEENAYLFYFDKDSKDLTQFIKANFIESKRGVSKIKIDKNNFMIIYNKWLAVVKPTIAVNWDIAKKAGIIDGDFYLADLLSQENETLKAKLYVLLKKDHYQLDRKLNEMGLFNSSSASFTDKQKAHNQFWNKYERPPKQEYWDYIVDRRDLLVPQDVRERKGSFFTPQIWVEKSQEYLADVLGENWQDEYYVWDCAAGTGNLLAGLTNKYHIWASTLDTQDVDVMHDRIETMNQNSIKGQGSNLLHDHVFQFDFLNDDFIKLPKPLQDIINDEEKRKKLVVYINPPYVEGDNRIGIGRKNVQASRIHNKYQSDLGKGSGELFAQFFMRIYREINDCRLAEFSTLKILQAPNFSVFRSVFLAKLEKFFMVPADTFDNVKGQFPIGFMIWDTSKKETFKKFKANVFDTKAKYIGTKKIYSFDSSKYISDWLEVSSKNISKDYIGHIASVGNDFQNQNAVFIDDVNKRRKKGGRHTMITEENLIVVSVYYAVRHCIKATWLNDRDQFLYPKKGWEKDTEFQNNCFAYTLFSNNIQSQYGTNHWIPFTEYVVGAKEKFDSNFMTNFIKGIDPTAFDMVNEPMVLFGDKKEVRNTPLKFSAPAKAVFNAGRLLWRHYHSCIDSYQSGEELQRFLSPPIEGLGVGSVNASLYDIRAYFQGRNDAGKMNNKSQDETYMQLITAVRDSLKDLAKAIEPKIYEYEFLKL
jgi:hypothetical protein